MTSIHDFLDLYDLMRAKKKTPHCKVDEIFRSYRKVLQPELLRENNPKVKRQNFTKAIIFYARLRDISTNEYIGINDSYILEFLMIVFHD